jgi:predicted nuclease of predicted toxin-antitoxin system
MRFKVDENLHDDIAALLASHGHDVHTVHFQGLRGAGDADLAQRCRNEDRALVTLDLDFADIRAYPPADYSGLIVLRVRDQSRRHVLDVLTRAIPLFAQRPLSGQLWILSESGVRIRS